MLYVTTTEKNDAFTAPRTFLQDRGPDGGLFVPRQFPGFTTEQFAQLEQKSFGERMAQILNEFFSCQLTGWDIDSAIGRCPVKVETMSHRIIFAELWQNLDGSYARLERVLAEKIRGDGDVTAKPSSWIRIAVRIAILFSLFAELVRAGELDWSHSVDVSACAGDMSGVMSTWYAREMGLPIGNIICSCNENSALWDLLHHGAMKTDLPKINTTTPLADTGLPVELERLIFAVMGWEQTAQYQAVCRERGLYVPPAENYSSLKSGMYAAVVSMARVDALIPSVYRTNSYVIGPYTALAYGGLTDYRAKTGQTRTALILAERSPLEDRAETARSMSMTEQQLSELLR